MNRLLLCIVIIVASCLNLKAQKVYQFNLEPANIKIANSLYNSLAIADFRSDTSHMGFIRGGFSNKYTPVSPATAISKQYKNLFSSVIDSTTAGNGKLLLLITRLLFAERENTLTYDGYFNMRANLYAKIASHYQKISTIDTVVEITSMDPTKTLIKTGNKVMTDFLIKNLTTEPSGPIYINYDLLNISATEKSETALYRAFDYTDGLYYTYKSFKNQTPDKQVIVDSADVNAGEIRTIEGGGVTLKVKKSEVYALVYKGHPYVMSQGCYYPLTKKDNEFIFTGRSRYSLLPGDILIEDMVGGSPKYFMLNGPTALFDMRLDYKNGAFIKLKLIVPTKEKSK